MGFSYGRARREVGGGGGGWKEVGSQDREEGQEDGREAELGTSAVGRWVGQGVSWESGRSHHRAGLSGGHSGGLQLLAALTDLGALWEAGPCGPRVPVCHHGRRSSCVDCRSTLSSLRRGWPCLHPGRSLKEERGRRSPMPLCSPVFLRGSGTSLGQSADRAPHRGHSLVPAPWHSGSCRKAPVSGVHKRRCEQAAGPPPPGWQVMASHDLSRCLLPPGPRRVGRTLGSPSGGRRTPLGLLLWPQGSRG